MTGRATNGLFILDEGLGGTDQHPVSWLLGFHAVNGLLILLLTLRLALLAVRRRPGIEASPA